MDAAISEWILGIFATVVTGLLGFICVDIRGFKKGMRTALYNQDGTTKFVLRGDCDRQASICQRMLCNKIEELKVIQKRADDKREEARIEYQSEIKKISVHMGKVEQYIKDHP